MADTKGEAGIAKIEIFYGPFLGRFDALDGKLR
jgi:hypothetical protein